MDFLKIIGVVYKIDCREGKMVLQLQEYQKDNSTKQKVEGFQLLKIDWHQKILDPRSDIDLCVGDKVKVEISFYGDNSLYEITLIDWRGNTSWDEATPLKDWIKDLS